MFSVRKVQVLGCPVGNLWDVMTGDVMVCRVSYNGNSLVATPRFGKIPHGKKAEIERGIDALYPKRSA